MLSTDIQAVFWCVRSKLRTEASKSHASHAIPTLTLTSSFLSASALAKEYFGGALLTKCTVYEKQISRDVKVYHSFLAVFDY